MEWTGSKYEGDLMKGRFEGEGKYVFPNGSFYKGEFEDGMFHGKGTLYFPDVGYYEATWKMGKSIKGMFYFKDGLKYELDGWDYCHDGDRRFYSEVMHGLKPAGESPFLHNIPVGTYDVGDGYFNPNDGNKYQYSGELISAPDADEIKWIKEKCRFHKP